MSHLEAAAALRRVGPRLGLTIVIATAAVGVGWIANARAATGPVPVAPAATPSVGGNTPNTSPFPPSAPTNVAAGPVTSHSATLTWTAATPGSSPIVGYDVQYYQVFNDLIWRTSVGNVTSATVTTNIQPASQYRFTVIAKDALGHTSSGAATVVVVTPLVDTGPDTTPPSAPGNLTISSLATTGAVLTWSASTDNVGVTGYNVYNFDGLFVSTLLTTVTGTTATVPFASPPRNQYYVRARDAVGNLSAVSNTVSVPAGPSPSPSPSSTCRVAYTLQSQWPGGFVVSVAISNTATSPVNGWTLGFAYQGDQQVKYAWNAAVNQSGATVTARSLDWNAVIPAGGSVSFGVQGTWTASLAAPTGYSLNGVACQAG